MPPVPRFLCQQRSQAACRGTGVGGMFRSGQARTSLRDALTRIPSDWSQRSRGAEESGLIISWAGALLSRQGWRRGLHREHVRHAKPRLHASAAAVARLRQPTHLVSAATGRRAGSGHHDRWCGTSKHELASAAVSGRAQGGLHSTVEPMLPAVSNIAVSDPFMDATCALVSPSNVVPARRTAPYASQRTASASALPTIQASEAEQHCGMTSLRQETLGRCAHCCRLPAADWWHAGKRGDGQRGEGCLRHSATCPPQVRRSLHVSQNLLPELVCYTKRRLVLRIPWLSACTTLTALVQASAQSPCSRCGTRKLTLQR